MGDLVVVIVFIVVVLVFKVGEMCLDLEVIVVIIVVVVVFVFKFGVGWVSLRVEDFGIDILCNLFDFWDFFEVLRLFKRLVFFNSMFLFRLIEMLLYIIFSCWSIILVFLGRYKSILKVLIFLIWCI